MKDTFFCSKFSLNLKGNLKEFDRPLVMGIVNATPDSFYAESRKNDISAAIESAKKMIDEGADILDIGGYSSRPGADDVPENEEMSRVLPVIKEIREHFPDVMISIDTFRSGVAEAAIAAGADMINDISGGQLDEKMYEVAARNHIPYILMHMRGTPQTMTEFTDYDNLMKDLLKYFSTSVQKARQAGIKDIIIDPGFGFSKTVDQNFHLMNNLSMLQMLESPVLVGISRKSMIKKTLGTEAKDSLNGTTILNTVALMKGAAILRVHDVKEARECVELVGRVVEG